MSDDYSRALARTAVGQLAELAGYEAVQDSSADILSELMIKYITELSSTAHGYAELASRTGINLHDLLWALDDLGTSVPELQAYLTSLKPEDNTFAHVLTDYPILKPGRSLPSWHDKQEEPPPHIPNFLPAFPDKHTYQATPTYPGHEMNPDKQAKALQKTRRQAEAAVLKLHHAQSAAAKASQAAAKSAAAASKPGTSASHSFLEPPTVNVVNLSRESGGGAANGGPEDGAGGLALQGGGTARQQGDGSGGGAGHEAGLQASTQGQQQHIDGVAQVPQGTGAYEPNAATKAFAPVLQLPDGTQGDGGAGDGDGDGTDLMAPEELMWRWRQRQDQAGVLKCALGAASDYTSTAFAAAHTYTVGAVEKDAYEEAAKEALQAQAGGRKRKSVYANIDKDPTRKKAQLVLDRAKKGTADQEMDD